MFCVSIAFVVGGKAVIGVINAPFLRQLFSACKGKGAFLNEGQQLPLVRNPIPPMPENAPKGCVFSCEWGKDRRDRPDGNLHRKVESFVNMAAEIGGRNGKGGMVHGVRSLGRSVVMFFSVLCKLSRLASARRWIWPTAPWVHLISGGRAVAGNGEWDHRMTSTCT